MAKNVTWHLLELSSFSLTLRIVHLTSGATLNGEGADTLTEGTNGKRTAVVAESISGWCKAYADGVQPAEASGFVNMDAAEPVVVETVAGTLAASDVPVPLIPPIWSNTRRLMNPTALEARTREARRHRVPIYADRQPVDLRSMTLQFALKLSSGSTVYVDTFSIEGADHNYACFVVPASAHTSAGTFEFAIRNTALVAGEKDLAWCEGTYEVKDAPGPSA